MGEAPAVKPPAAERGRAFAGLEPAERKAHQHPWGGHRKADWSGGSQAQQGETWAPVRMPHACSFGAVWDAPRPPARVAYGHSAGLYPDLPLGECEDAQGGSLSSRECPSGAWHQDAGPCLEHPSLCCPSPTQHPGAVGSDPSSHPTNRGSLPSPHRSIQKQAWK